MAQETVSVIIRARDLASRVLRRVERRFQSLVRALRRSAVGVGVFAAGAIFAGKKLFDLGAGVVETKSKFRTVFGDMADEVDEFVNSFGQMAGLSRTQGRELVATAGAIAQGLGFAGDASAQMAQEIVRLAADLGSFNNLPTEDVANRITTALTGERESLKRLGIVVTEAEVRQVAFANRSEDVTGALTQQEKATATLQIITRQAGVAIGDLGRTMDSPANKARRLGAEFRTIAEDFATQMLPVLESLIPLIETLIRRFEKFARKAAEAATVVADLFGADVGVRRETRASVGTIPEALLGANIAAAEAEITRLTARYSELADERDRIMEGGIAQSELQDLVEVQRQLAAVLAEITEADVRLQELERRAQQLRAAAAPRPGPAAGGGGLAPAGRAPGPIGTVPMVPITGQLQPRGGVLRHVQQLEEMTDVLEVWGAEIDAAAAQAQFMQETVTHAFAQMATSVISGAQSAATAVIQMITRIAAAAVPGPLGGILGAFGGILGALTARRPMPVRLDSYSDQAIGQLTDVRGDLNIHLPASLFGVDDPRFLDALQRRLSANAGRNVNVFVGP